MKLIKLQQWLIKQNRSLTWGAGILVVMGLILQHGFNQLMLANWLYGIAALATGFPILIKALSALFARVMSIELLVSIAVVGAIIIMEFEEAAMVTFLFAFGNLLEQRTLKKTHQAIQALTEMQPTTAVKIEDGNTYVVEVDEIEPGDLLKVKVGDKIPVDGKVVDGEAELNEAVITGESKLVHKQANARLFMGSIVENGQLTIKADKVGEDTTFGKIIELVEEAQDNQAPASRFIDRFAKYYTPLVLVIAILIYGITRDFKLAITILVLACPGALVIGAPVSNVAGIGRAAKGGILIKGGSVMDQLAKVDSILMDKTGTITQGQPTVRTYQLDQANHQWLKLAAQLESQTNHPLAQAIINFYQQQTGEIIERINTDVTTIKGIGIQARIDHQIIQIGSSRILEQTDLKTTPKQIDEIKALENQGQTVILMTVDNDLVLILGLIDQVRSGVAESLQSLRQAGVKNVAMLTGDNRGVAKQIGSEVGIEQIQAQMMPAAKADYLAELQKQGHKILFVGDGINDSPAIAQADVGIAMGSGTDVAMETSDVVLINSEFKNINAAHQISKATIYNMFENILIAIGTVGLLLIGVAFGWVNMASGMLFHEISILVVIFNAMRLLRIRFKE